MSKYLKKTLTIFLSSILLLLIVTVSILWGFSNDLPDYKFLKNYKAPVSSKVYSGDGDLIQDFSSEKRIFIPYNSIPKIVINSFLSAEDKNFFDHPGIDAKGVLRAIIKNISNISRGGICSVLIQDARPSHSSLLYFMFLLWIINFNVRFTIRTR